MLRQWYNETVTDRVATSITHIVCLSLFEPSTGAKSSFLMYVHTSLHLSLSVVYCSATTYSKFCTVVL